VVKNKVAAPFRTAEFDIYYNEGISKTGDIFRAGLQYGIIKQSGSFFSFEGQKLGQGGEAVKVFLKENPQVAEQIKKLAMEKE
jgi:recombination protein RecA